MSGPPQERCLAYAPRAADTATKNTEPFGKKPPRAPRKAPKSMNGAEEAPQESLEAPKAPKAGTLQRQVFDLIAASGEKGCTDPELMAKTGLERHAVAVAREDLVAARTVWDSGIRRRDAAGHENAAWTTKSAEDVPADAGPMLVRDDVYVTQSSRATTLHAGTTTIRLSPTPGDLVEVTTTPQGADPDQDGGPGVTVLLVVDGNEELYSDARNPFATQKEIIDMMGGVINPALAALSAVMKDL